MSDLTPRSRLLAALKGEPTDYVPFSPFLAYYFDFLPREVRRRGEFAYLKEMGADPLFRGGTSAYITVSKNCTVSEKQEGNKRYCTYTTPKGVLYAEHTYVSEADTWFETKHPVETIEQIPAALEFFKDLQVVDCREDAKKEMKRIGDDGLILAKIGIRGKTAYQFMIERLVGTENLAYLTYDEPEALEELLDVIRKKNWETIELSLDCGFDACLSWEDTSTTNVSPNLYDIYIKPEITSWCKALHEVGIPYVQHACGHIRHLLPAMAEQGNDAIESLSPPPTGNVTVEDAFSILPDRVSIIGGIEPTQFINASIPELLEYVDHIIDIKGNHGFILANSDSCPPNVEYEKFIAISNFVRQKKL